MSPEDQRADRPQARRGIVVLLAILVVAVSGFLAVSPAAAQVPGGQGATPVTTHQLLDGPTTAAPVPTTAVPDSVSRSGPVKTKSADTKKVWGVVATLVLVAVCLFLLTLFYVRRTRPEPPDSGRRPAPTSPPVPGRRPQDKPRPQGPRDSPVRPPDARVAPTRTAGSSRMAQARTPRTPTPGGDPNRVRAVASDGRGRAGPPPGHDARSPMVRRPPPPLRRTGAPAGPRRSAG